MEEGKEITNPFILHVDLAPLTGHLKINCQASFEEKALLLTVSCQEISNFVCISAGVHSCCPRSHESALPKFLSGCLALCSRPSGLLRCRACITHRRGPACIAAQQCGLPSVSRPAPFELPVPFRLGFLYCQMRLEMPLVPCPSAMAAPQG